MVCVCPDAPVGGQQVAVIHVRPDTTYSLRLTDPSGTRLICVYRPDGHYTCHPLGKRRP